MNGTDQSEVIVTLRNPTDYSDQLTYYITVEDSVLAQDWLIALKEILSTGLQLEKNFCLLGFPNTARDLEYLCNELMISVDTINNFFTDYTIDEVYSPTAIASGQELLNVLHNHFERLQGTVDNLSDYYRRADYDTKYAIRQLNNICHEIESLLLSQHKAASAPQWVRPSQITTFLQVPRYNLKPEHRELFLTNGYDRKFGGVYMHWTQIGKTLFEVFRDEGAPDLTDTVCEAISSLKYYSGEFDVEWGNDVVYGGSAPWHDAEQDLFKKWLISQGLDPKDPSLSLGYLPLGYVNLEKSFNTTDTMKIRNLLGEYLDIVKIQVSNVSATYDYCWNDPDYKQQQIEKLKAGYDFSSRR